MRLEIAFAGEEFAAAHTCPFSSMGLEFMGEPFIPATEHAKVAFFESTDIGSEISEDVFSV